jgi:hypothetical protein
MKKVIKPLCETMNENPKCHLHIPQPRNGIYVLNSPSRTYWKKNLKEKDSKRTPKTLIDALSSS